MMHPSRALALNGLAILCLFLSTPVFATNQATNQPTSQATNPATAQNAPAPLRQANTQTTTTNSSRTPPSEATIRANMNKAIEQAVVKRSADMQKRLTQLEAANQSALAENQELQLKNDNLTVQVQVLQSERSAQMFLYGAVTLGIGVIIGVVLYNLMSNRRRRF
ncbi:hypothetical protein SAMN05421749_102435 [Acinetobacter marinus]|uniref:SH3 domain protein n=1 Tax=Acinetobacter marinus TaxID=281375 RepID=A0A1G6HR25_9GAMM|nr:hypothetical protein SAMN05421749_102435 [Acinetobacter marinus]